MTTKPISNIQLPSCHEERLEPITYQIYRSQCKKDRNTFTHIVVNAFQIRKNDPLQWVLRQYTGNTYFCFPKLLRSIGDPIFEAEPNDDPILDSREQIIEKFSPYLFDSPEEAIGQYQKSSSANKLDEFLSIIAFRIKRNPSVQLIYNDFLRLFYYTDDRYDSKFNEIVGQWAIERKVSAPIVGEDRSNSKRSVLHRQPEYDKFFFNPISDKFNITQDNVKIGDNSRFYTKGGDNSRFFTVYAPFSSWAEALPYYLNHENS